MRTLASKSGMIAARYSTTVDAELIIVCESSSPVNGK